MKAAVYALERAHETLDKAIALIKVANADTEPAPFAVVLTRDKSSGQIHRRGRIEGIPGYMTFGRCNLERDTAGAFEVIRDLSTVRDESDLCQHCFGPLDEQKASDRPEEDATRTDRPTHTEGVVAAPSDGNRSEIDGAAV